MSYAPTGASEERGVDLLQDIRAAFRSTGRVAFTTKTLLASHLCADAEGPWATWNKGKPITDRQVAKLLKEFSVFSENVQQSETGEAQAKGYRLARFEDIFRRYLPADNSVSPQDGGSGASKRTNADGMGTTSDFCVRPETFLDRCEKCEKPANHAGLDAWTDKKPKTGAENDLAKVGPADDRRVAVAECAHRCAQCGGEPDGREHLHMVRGEPTWLHRECARFFRPPTGDPPEAA
jgi:putative DNA primase/helicase